MKLLTDKISIAELMIMSEKMFGELVKAVVDVRKEIMVVDASLHAEKEFFLLQEGSKQEDLWGINLFPKNADSVDFVVFDSMINLRPRLGNKSWGFDDPAVQEKIKKIVHKLVQK